MRRGVKIRMEDMVWTNVNIVHSVPRTHKIHQPYERGTRCLYYYYYYYYDEIPSFAVKTHHVEVTSYLNTRDDVAEKLERKKSDGKKGSPKILYDTCTGVDIVISLVLFARYCYTYYLLLWLLLFLFVTLFPCCWCSQDAHSNMFYDGLQ